MNQIVKAAASGGRKPVELETKKTIRQVLMPDHDLSQLLKQDMSILHNIESAQMRIREYEKSLFNFKNNGASSIESDMIDIKNQADYEIAMDKENYKNDVQRKAGAIKLLSEHVRYQELSGELKDSKISEFEIIQHIAEKKDELQIYKLRFTAWSDLMKVVAGLSVESFQSKNLSINPKLQIEVNNV